MEDSSNWIAVYSTDIPYKAEIIKQILLDNQITAFVMNKRDSFYQFGDIEICVKPADVLRAKHVLNDIEL